MLNTHTIYLTAFAVGFVMAEELIAGLLGDAKLPMPYHLLVIKQPGDKSNTLIHQFTHFPGHLKFPLNAQLCIRCARNIVLPMCRGPQKGPSGASKQVVVAGVNLPRVYRQ